MEEHKCKLLVTKKEYDILHDNHHCIQYIASYNNIECNDLIDSKVKHKYAQLSYSRTFLQDESVDYSIKKDINHIKRYKIYETFDDIIPEIPPDFPGYTPRQFLPRTALHLGQLKLFLSTLQFLSLYAPKDREVHIVYPGSAPGHNLIYIMKLFPQTRWYLIDPQDLTPSNTKYDKQLFNHPQVKYIKKDYLTEKICHYLHKILRNKYTLLISDIRLSSDDESIDIDNKLNKLWIDIINPDFAQLKWRIPYDERGENYEYYDGIIYVQYYPHLSSTETRLVVNGKNPKKKMYNNILYDGVLSFFNQNLRCSIYNYKDKLPYMDGCHDCAGFAFLIDRYKRLYPENTESKMTTKGMMAKIVSLLSKNVHTFQRMKENYNSNKLIKI